MILGFAVSVAGWLIPPIFSIVLEIRRYRASKAIEKPSI
jgi:hypothetical protein